MLNFGARLFTFEIVNSDGTTWGVVTVKADSAADAAVKLGSYGDRDLFLR
jgi:hypothetical protein